RHLAGCRVRDAIIYLCHAIRSLRVAWRTRRPPLHDFGESHCLQEALCFASLSESSCFLPRTLWVRASPRLFRRHDSITCATGSISANGSRRYGIRGDTAKNIFRTGRPLPILL